MIEHDKLTGIERELVLQYLIDGNVPVTLTPVEEPISENKEDTEDPQLEQMRAVTDAVQQHQRIVPCISAFHTVVLAAHPLFLSTNLPCGFLQQDLAVADVAAEQHICRNAVRCAAQLHGADFGKIRQRFALLFRQFTEYQMIRRTAVNVVLKAVHADAVENKHHRNDRDRCCNADDRKGRLPFLRLDIAGSKQAFISHGCQPPPPRNCRHSK